MPFVLTECDPRQIPFFHRDRAFRFYNPPQLLFDRWIKVKPALEAVGLPATRPATKDAPAIRGVRLHDLRHTFAVLQLSAGTHFMQVSKWLGHGTYTLTLDVYGDYIPEEDGGAANNLPEPPAPTRPSENVVPLRREG